MRRWILTIAALVGIAAGTLAQGVPPVGDRLDEVMLQLAPDRRPEARMLIARTSGTGRRILRSALGAAGRIPAGSSKPRSGTASTTLKLVAAQMGKSEAQLFAGVYGAMNDKDRGLLVEMLRLRAALKRS